MSQFHFPRPGELHNEEAIPMATEDLYRLLMASAPLLIAGGESDGTEDPLNAPLLSWWNGMNALPRPLRVRAQRLIRETWGGKLPPSPWEDLDDQGTPLAVTHMTWRELSDWAQAQDDAE